MTTWAIGLMILGVLIVMATDTAADKAAADKAAADKAAADKAAADKAAADKAAADKAAADKAAEDQLKPGADGKYSQEQMDALLGKERDRLDIKAKDAEKRIEDEVKKRLEDEKKRQEMSELEKAQADLQAASTERDALRQEAAIQQNRAELQDWIARNAPPELPAPYRQLVEGEDEDQRQASLKGVIEQYQGDFKERTGQSVSVGGATQPGAQPGEGETATTTTETPYEKYMREAAEAKEAAGR